MLLPAGPGRDQLTDDDVLLQTNQLVLPALDGRLCKHPGRFLEGCRGKPRISGQGGLGNPHEFGSPLGRLVALVDEAPVGVGEHPLVDLLAGEKLGVAWIADPDSAGHLSYYQFDVLVVNRHTLVPVDLLNLVHQVLLGLPHSLDLQQLLGVAWSFNNGVPSPDLLTVDHLETGRARDQVYLLGAVLSDHRDLAAPTLILTDPDHA